ncbi:hypothetical protein ACPW96_18080 [Micromonospora sp. DT81.3]
MTSSPVLFSSVVTEYWIPRNFDRWIEGAFHVVVDPSLEDA